MHSRLECTSTFDIPRQTTMELSRANGTAQTSADADEESRHAYQRLFTPDLTASQDTFDSDILISAECLRCTDLLFMSASERSNMADRTRISAESKLLLLLLFSPLTFILSFLTHTSSPVRYTRLFRVSHVLSQKIPFRLPLSLESRSVKQDNPTLLHSNQIHKIYQPCSAHLHVSPLSPSFWPLLFLPFSPHPPRRDRLSTSEV